jgi:DNA-3-methyladenine glycosylase II
LSPLTAVQTLTELSFSKALEQLARRDADLAVVLTQHGPPPIWVRPPGFVTLVQIILEQQVSLASARAAFERLLEIASPLTPARFLQLDDATLKAVGFSRQKTRYCRQLAEAVLAGSVDIDGLAGLDDGSARQALVRITGVGPWTAEIYLLMALRRADAWPAGDLALATAAHSVKRLPARPSSTEMEALGEGWRPWRSVAAHILWHDYLSTR